MSRSADISFRLIALQKGLLGKERLDEAQAEARRRRVPLEQVLAEAGDLDPADLERVRGTRARHARRCSACGQLTYLLPRQTVATTPCERCGGTLEEAAGPGPRAGAPRSTGPGARAAARPPSREASPRPGSRPAPAAASAAGAVPREGRDGRADDRASPPGRPSDRPSGRAPAPTAPGPPPVVESADEAAAREERARRLRREGGGFGYAPPEEPIERPRGRLGLPSGPPPGAVEPAPGEATSDHDDEDARFAPPAEHLARFVQGRAPTAPVPPIRQDLANLLRFPVQTKETVALVTLGALFLMLGGVGGGAGAGGFAMFKTTMLLGLLFVAYPALYQARITRTSIQGSQELPDWPDFHFGDIVAFALRLLATMVACFAPAALVLFLLALASGGGSADAGPRLTIGDDAYLSAPKEPYIPRGTPMSVEEPFLDLDENPRPVGRGRWTIVGLLGRDLADDTGMTQMLVDMPRGGFGVVINPAWQVYDLDRVARSLPEVTVYAAYADPAEVLIGARFPWTQDAPSDAEAFDEGLEEEDEAGEFGEAERAALGESLEAAQGMAELSGRLAGDGRDWTAGGAAPPLEAVELVKTETIDWPAPLDRLETYPAVVVIDPQGRVVREYSSGVHDEKLYSDVKDLMAGGEGNVWSTEELPIQGGGGGLGGAGAVVGSLLFVLLVVAGYLYLPMAWLLMVAFDSPTTPFMYGAGVRAIAIAWRDYLALGLALLGLQLAGWVILKGVGGVLEAALPWYVGYPLVGFAGHWIQFYGMLVTAYGVGRYYYANRRAIDWFGEAVRER